ncbi:MAG: STAS domain-containing protein [Ruminobacter sp.]|jgi:anti-anti-sigma factor|nr:STAS domain-containing protein [Ruminobacter sp.]
MELIGRIDSTNAGEWENRIKNNLPESGDYELDCTQLSYISSAGIRILISVYKVLKGRNSELIMKDVSPAVKEVLDLTGVADFLKFI